MSQVSQKCHYEKRKGGYALANQDEGRTTRHSRFAPGYRIRGKVAIYKACHEARGWMIWKELVKMMEEGQDVWLEFGPLYGHEYFTKVTTGHLEEWQIERIS